MADDVAATPPAADVGAAPVAAGADAAADQPMTRLEIAEAISQAPREDQPELYRAYSEIFHQPAPAPHTPQNAREADALLAELTSDGQWWDKFSRKDPATVKQWHDLNWKKSQPAPFDPSAETGDISVGPGLEGPKVSRREWISAAADLHAKGASDAELELIRNDQPYPADVVRDAHYWLPRMQSDPFLRVPLPGYQEADREGLMRFFQRAIAIGDGSGW
jgi:hypothetical protein